MDVPINFKHEVWEFFLTVLSNYKEAVYYENLRGHSSKASPLVKGYIKLLCKGEDLLKFLENGKSYFSVKDGYVSLKKASSLQNGSQNKQAESCGKIKILKCLIESLEFFVDILEQKNCALDIQSLTGYLSQTTRDFRTFVLTHRKSFKSFFQQAPAIFLMNRNKVSLSSNYNEAMLSLKKLLSVSKNGELQLYDLQSKADCILQGKCVQTMGWLKDSICEETKAPYSAEPVKSRLPESKNSEIDEAVTDLSETDIEELIRCVFSVELFCLAMTEKKFCTWGQSQILTIQYFIAVLLRQGNDATMISDLKESLLVAPDYVVKFMNEEYSEERFLSFFIENSEFEVYFGIIKLNPTYQTKYFNKKAYLSQFSPERTEYNISKFYETKFYQKYLKETFAFLYEVYIFLEDKHSSMEDGPLKELLENPNYPNCTKWVQKSEGASSCERLRNFLNTFNVNVFSQSKPNFILIRWLKQKRDEFFQDEIPYKTFSAFLTPLLKSGNTPVLYNKSGMCRSSKNSFIEYHELVNLFTASKLLWIVLELGSDSRHLIDSISNSRQFLISNGKIELKEICSASEIFKSNVPGTVITHQQLSEKIGSQSVSTTSRISEILTLQRIPKELKQRQDLVSDRNSTLTHEGRKTKDFKSENEESKSGPLHKLKKEESSKGIQAPVNFASEQCNKAYDFFVEVLSFYTKPVLYENLRGHISRAPPIVRNYVKKHCKGTKLLDFFTHNTKFIVAGAYVSLDIKSTSKTKSRNTHKQLKVKFAIDNTDNSSSIERGTTFSQLEPKKNNFKDENDVKAVVKKVQFCPVEDTEEENTALKNKKTVELPNIKESSPSAARGRSIQKELRLQKEKLKQEDYEKKSEARKEKIARLLSCNDDAKKERSRTRSRSRSKTRSLSKDKTSCVEKSLAGEDRTESVTRSRSKSTSVERAKMSSTAKRGRKRESRRKRLRRYKEKVKQEEEEAKLKLEEEEGNLSSSKSVSLLRSSSCSEIKNSSPDKSIDSKSRKNYKLNKNNDKEKAEGSKVSEKEKPLTFTHNANAEKSEEDDADESTLTHSEYVKKFFVGLLTRQGKIKIDSIEFDLLPKKVKRHLSQYFQEEVREYFSKYPELFGFDREGNVFLKTQF